MNDKKRGGGSEEWSKLWSLIKDTVREKDVYYVMDELKLDYISALLPRTGKVLEVGCGSARVSTFLARRGLAAYGIDRDSQAIAVASRNFSLNQAMGTFVRGDAQSLPFEDGVFDVVFSTGLLEHFEDPSPIMLEMTRVLEPGGFFWSDIVPSKFSLLRALDGLRFESIRGKSTAFERDFKKGEIIRLLQSAGIQKPTVFSAGVFPPLWLPGLSKFSSYRRFHAKIASDFKEVWSRFDRTAIADLLGFYYLCYGRKE